MNERRSSKLWTIAILVITGSVLAAAALQDPTVFIPQRPKPEKICPITFHLDPVTTLQARFAADTERTNGKLATKLSEFRSSLPAHPPGEPDTKLWLAHLADEYDDAFAKTYLKAPVLVGEDGLEYKGWHNILVYLSSVIPHTTYIVPQSVNVYLEYLPLGNQTTEYLLKRGVRISGFKADEIDFLATIRTVLAYAPYDPPMEIRNEATVPHRKICDPIY
jgi:hypothetical protein